MAAGAFAAWSVDFRKSFSGRITRRSSCPAGWAYVNVFIAWAEVRKWWKLPPRSVSNIVLDWLAIRSMAWYRYNKVFFFGSYWITDTLWKTNKNRPDVGWRFDFIHFLTLARYPVSNVMRLELLKLSPPLNWPFRVMEFIAFRWMKRSQPCGKQRKICLASTYAYTPWRLSSSPHDSFGCCLHYAFFSSSP